MQDGELLLPGPLPFRERLPAADDITAAPVADIRRQLREACDAWLARSPSTDTVAYAGKCSPSAGASNS